MALQRRYKNVTKLTAALLESGENDKVDFKMKADGIHPDDFVAFANTKTGGDILIGVSDEKRSDGSQFGAIVGCDLSDQTILQILNKAISCIPPISIKLFAENISSRPFLRVHIPSSGSKPHCSPKGVFCRREGSRNRPMHPSELLEIFLDAEANAFASRFEEAADVVTEGLFQLETSLEERIDSMGSQLGWAESNVADTVSTVDSVLAHVMHLIDETDKNSTRLRALFRQDEREDPVRAKARTDLMEELISQLKDDAELFEQLSSDGEKHIKITGGHVNELNEAEARQLVAEALEAVRRERQDDCEKPD